MDESEPLIISLDGKNQLTKDELIE